jgi:hypothetical protein
MTFSLRITLNEEHMRTFYQSLNEKDRRHYAAVEAGKFGHGGIACVCQILGCDPKTVRRGIEELRNPPDLPPKRIRKKGGTQVLS